MVMYNLVRFTIDGVYFVCRAKDLWRKGKKTITKWYDKLSYEVEVVTSSKKKKILDDLCGNLNGNKPRILLEVLREDYEIKKTSFENVDVQFSVHPEEYNDENNKETPKCIECSCTFELNDHLCFSFGESEISDFESPTNDELCMQCGILCPNLEEHLLTVHSSTQIAGELDFESPNNDELCMQCGILCPNLEEHLTAHSTTEIAVDNSKPNSGKYHLCMYCGVLCPGLKEHLVTSHGADGLDSDGVEVQTKQNHQSYESKQHFCVYCQTLHFKLARHLESRHHHEKDVEEALKYMKGCKQRKQLFLEIQKKGDFLYYTEHKESTIHLRRRPDSLGLIPCPYCKGFYSKKYLRNHVRLHCIVKSHQKKLEFEKNGLSNLVSKSRSLVPVTLCNANDILKSRIFPTMTENENFKALLSDELGVEYGNYLTTKYSSSKHHDKMIKAKLRQLSRLFLEMKKFNSNIEKMSSIFDPENFNTFVEAIYSMAGLKDGKFETPSLGPSTVTLILDVGGVLETETIKNKNEKMERNCKRFCKLLKTKCNSLINRIAMENRTQQQRGKTVVLPKTEDIRNLVNSLEIEMKNCLNFMQKDFIYQKWITLNKVVLTKIMVYNRKRPGDVEKSRIIEYRNIEMLNEEQIQHLQGSDRDFGTKYGRYITRGKLDRPAAVLVSRNDMDAIDLILQYRRSAGVDDNNPYLFATPCGMAEQFFKVGKALKDYCVENNFSNKNLTATNMRKHLATVTCSFGKDEQMQVSDFMGHAFNIHQNIYRQRPASLDILGMSKLLNYASGVEEPGTSSNSQVNILSNIRLQPDYMNNPEPHRLETEHLPDKNFKFTSGESIRSVECVTPCQMYSSEEDEEDNNFVPDLSTVEENDNTSDEEYSCSHSYSRTRENSERLLPKSYRITRKKTWSTPERVTMRKIFRHYLNENIEDIPTLETCQNFTYQNPVLSSRSPAQMKAWIVQEKKRNKTGSKSGWTTPLRKKCRKKFENFYSSGKYPSSSELMDIIEESPDVSLTVSKLRSHLQHDFKYAKRQHQQGRRFF